MKYRINRRTGDRISEIGLGSAYLCDAVMDEAVRALRAAYDGGINYFDLGAGNGRAFSMWREALADVRENALYQVHFGADYSKGEYGWTLELETVKRSVDWMLKLLLLRGHVLPPGEGSVTMSSPRFFHFAWNACIHFLPRPLKMADTF